MPRPSKYLEVFNAFYESDRDKSAAEIANELDVCRKTVNNHIDVLLEEGDIEPTRVVAGAQMYETTQQ